MGGGYVSVTQRWTQKREPNYCYKLLKLHSKMFLEASPSVHPCMHFMPFWIVFFLLFYCTLLCTRMQRPSSKFADLKLCVLHCGVNCFGAVVDCGGLVCGQERVNAA